jgi:hypothetical protein
MFRSSWLAVISMAVLGSVAYGALPAKAVPTEPRSIDTRAVANLGERAEGTYDAAKAQKWAVVLQKVRALRNVEQGLQIPPAAQRQIADATAALKEAARSRNTHSAMLQANQLTLIAANLNEASHPQVPTDVARLDYYGRQLEIWSAAPDLAKLQSTTADIRRIWQNLRPAVEAHGGQRVAMNFARIVNRLESAKTPAEYQTAATAELDEVDKLERIFERQ